jgi:hypothetical protein
MKKEILLLLTAILSLNCYSQISFEKGYFINNNEEKIQCFIKNVDWENNPKDFKYKLLEKSDPKTASIAQIKEFGIYNYSKYIRSNVNIDRSTSNINTLKSNRNPVFKEKEKLFLEVLVEGASNLYQYNDVNLVRFFYSVGEPNTIEPLIFKNYKITGDNIIRENNQFRQQLLNNLKCESINLKGIKKARYKEDDLIDLFIQHNQCINSDFSNYKEKQKTDLFNLNLRVGLNSASFSMTEKLLTPRVLDFGNKISLKLGLEAELILPFNKNKWAILFEPTYSQYKSEKEFDSNNIEVNYRFIEATIGIRHYFFLNSNSKLFINGTLNSDLAINSTITNHPYGELTIKSSSNFSLGLGYKQNDKFSLELRYYTNKLISQSQFYQFDYNTLSVIFGYTLF